MARILIVEDNALNVKLFCDLLAAHGHEPQAVTDSRQALDAAHDFSPDLVITDIQLPHVTGFDLIRMMRADDRLSDVPIMAVTAYAARGDEERIRAAGAQAYVSKPISVVRFAETVDELLQSANGAGPENDVMDGPGPTEAGEEELNCRPRLASLDLGFLELDVLARLRVVLLSSASRSGCAGSSWSRKRSPCPRC